MLMTHKTQIRGVFDVAISPRYRRRFIAMVPCKLPVFFIVKLQTSWFYHSTTLLIRWFLHDFVLQLVETTVCFTIDMIQHMFSILIYSFNHIFIKLSWIEDSDHGSVELQNYWPYNWIQNKSHYIKLNSSRPVSLQCIWLTSWPADQLTKSWLKTVSAQQDKHSKWSTFWPMAAQQT